MWHIQLLEEWLWSVGSDKADILTRKLKMKDSWRTPPKKNKTKQTKKTPNLSKLKVHPDLAHSHALLGEQFLDNFSNFLNFHVLLAILNKSFGTNNNSFGFSGGGFDVIQQSLIWDLWNKVNPWVCKIVISPVRLLFLMMNKINSRK